MKENLWFNNLKDFVFYDLDDQEYNSLWKELFIYYQHGLDSR